MLPKKNRATKKIIEKIFKIGRFVNSENLTLKFILENGSTPAHISVVAPKTVAKSAVMRNLLRRRGYIVLEKYFHKFPVGFQGALIFGKKSADVFGQRKSKKVNPILELENEIKNILSKL